VDYAPEPKSLECLYQALQTIPHKRLIHVLGSCGGGRDVARRPILGRMAGQTADVVIVTNEDPYDDDPQVIMEQVAAGARRAGKVDGKSLWMINDRYQAILKAMQLAQTGDLVLLTGKGSERAICVAGGKKIPWDERAAARRAIDEVRA
jgi:UDP-N-acetylmuramoyl-L-alanyl-D-glutamate--2,6-diaminopimelate ligase